MKKLALLLFCLVALVSVSHAAAVTLPQSGQKTILAQSDDGEIKAGQEWPAQRFNRNDNQTVTDLLTGLMWTQDANLITPRRPGDSSAELGDNGEVSWQSALNLITKLNMENYLGYSDWRLPNLNELASLLNQEEVKQSAWLIQQGFINTLPSNYWTSTSVAFNARQSWIIHFAAGNVEPLSKTNTALVWPVRGKDADELAVVALPKTGQVTCYDESGKEIPCKGTGQDGELRAGAEWPVLRFSHNDDHTVTDNVTGLVWAQRTNLIILRDPSFGSSADGGVVWHDALEYVNRLNREAYLGYSDWRLPNRNELVSLVNYAETDPATWVALQGISHPQQHYWSSTTSASSFSHAWNIDLAGSVKERNKYDSANGSFVWPVRGGLVAPVDTSASSVIQSKSVSTQVAAAAAATLAVTTASLPAGTIGTAYSQTLAASGGTTPYTWSRTTGNLPAGLSLSKAGVISGTPTAAATSTFTVQVKDKSAKTATKSLSIVVNAAPLSITTATVADGYLTTTYSQTLAASGGKTAYTWSITSGALPIGLSLAASTGVISDTPTATGTSSITIQVKDANATIVSKPLTITVYALPAISTSNVPTGVAGTAYSQTLAATGGKPPYIWSVSTGTLPAGITLNTATGVVYGTPSTAVTSSVTFKVTDANAKTATKALSIMINAAPLSIATASLADGYLTTAYSQTLTAIGGKTAYSWSLTSGTLPAGLSLATSTGVISGTPTATGTSSITIQIKDANSTTAIKALSITAYALPAITTITLPAAGIGTAYNQTLAASGGKSPITWSLSSGTLPAGISLNASSGVISGIPTTAGTSSVSFKVTDANAKSVTKALSITVSTTPPTITTTSLNAGAIGVSYSQTLTATGGKTPYSWSRTAGTLPAGLTLSSAGVISGKPTTLATSNFTVQVKDANNATATRAFSLTVAPPLTLDTSQPAYGTVGGSYSYALIATGGSQPYSWSILGGTLPVGLTLNAATGVISGVPNTSGWTEMITIQVKDASNVNTTGEFWLNNLPAPQISTDAAYDSYVGFSYGLQLASTGGLPPYTWSIVSGSLPPGLSLDSTKGKLSGTATTVGSSTFTVQITDSNGSKGTKTYTLIIANFGSISGVVTDQATGAPLVGVAVSLELAGITNRNVDDLIYTCNNIVPVDKATLSVFAENDSYKFICANNFDGSPNVMLFKVRNPFGTADAFSVSWNGRGTPTFGTEFLAQRFKPTRNGRLNMASFHLPHGITFANGTPVGAIRVMLKSKLGGDIGTYLAISNSLSVADFANSSQVWLDFIFPTPATVNVGQDYYLEITGKYYGQSGNSGYYSSMDWDGSNYADGLVFGKEGGQWSNTYSNGVSLGRSMAFRTYLDNQIDITTEVLYNSNLSMSGDNISPYPYFRFNMDGSSGVTMTFNGPTPDNDGDDITGVFSASSNLSGYYDPNGWLRATLTGVPSFVSSAISLVTDQLSITFSRSLTAVTDANGAYSFTGLPDGKYTLAIDKAPYNTEVHNGSLQVGEAVLLSTALSVKADIRIATNALTIGVEGRSYNQVVTTAGGTAPFKWSIIAGVLPAGLTLNSDTGVISGTLGITPASYFVIQVRDANNKTAAKGFTLRISPTPVLPQIGISSSNVGFGYATIHNTYPAVLTVKNSGSTNLVIGQITQPSTPYQVSSDNCSGQTLAAAATCTIKLQFSPTHTGYFLDTFNIPSSDENYPDMWVSLSGEGIFKYILPDTGRGEFVKNPISFAVNSVTSATDNNTRLMWQRNASETAMTWTEAGAYCQNLTLDGYNDWRLPNFVELTTIVNFGTANPAIDTMAFPVTHSDNYWTTTEVGSQYGTSANFTYGESGDLERTSTAFVRCARGEELKNIFSTESYMFMGLNISVFNDLNTGLGWTGDSYDASGDAYSGYCNYLNSTALAVYQDWRLPTIKELATMPAPSCTILGNCLAWSATPSSRPDDLGNLTQVYLYSSGSIVSAPRSDTHPLRCVRGGNKAMQIGEVSVREIGANSAVIQWSTIQPATGVVEYGVTTEYGSSIADTGMLTQHTVSLNGLTPMTTYHYQVKSITAQGGVTFSPDQVFTTAPSSTPMIQGIVLTNFGSEIAVATVVVADGLGRQYSTVTDALGNYQISGMGPGEYSVTFAATGMISQTVSITLAAGQVLNKKIWLYFLPITHTITTPTDGSVISTPTVTVTGTVENAVTVSILTWYGQSYPATILNGVYSATIPLDAGPTRVYVGATNSYGISKEKSVLVTRTEFTITNLGDSGNVAIMEAGGNYDAKNPDGSTNDTPRQAIAKEYIRTHGDNFDFLVFLSTFDYALPESGAEGFYLPVRNDVQGINQPIFDYSAQFGSASKLQGTVDLGSVMQLAAAPYGPLLDTNVRLLNHELMHRFGGYVRYLDQNGMNSSLLGKDSAHWSYLLDTKGSIMYGNGWKVNQDGTFTATAARSAYSPLDLYLMGLIPKEQVPPMLLIENPAIDKNQLPQLGATVTGTARTVTIDDIIAAEGDRIPNAAASQKKFNVGFVLLSRPGDSTAAATQAVETLRSAWAGRLAEQTNGIGGISGITPSVSVIIDSPTDGAIITGPNVTVSGTIINTSGAETGVTVNGMPATVTGNRFITNHVQLSLGSNTISATAMDANGLTTSVARSVNSAPGNYIRISSNIESGTGPLEVNLRIDGSFAVTAPVVHVTGPGGAATLTPISETEYAATFISEGTYTVTATATGPDGQSYADSAAITVVSKFRLDGLLKAKWDAMRNSLASGDVSGAVINFNEMTKDAYQQQFATLSASLPQIAAGMGNISFVKVEDNIAEYDMRDLIDGVTYSFYLLFVKSRNGIWKIRNF